MENDREHVDQLTTATRAKGFLGREFLTWLWYLAETKRERQKVPLRVGKGSYEFDLWIDDRMVMEANAGMAQQNVMTGGDPSQSQEAGAALATGKTVRELKVGINVKGVGEFSALLGCEDLNPRSLRLPAPQDEAGTTAVDELPIATRLGHMSVFLTVIDGLFARFLDVRTADSWEEETLPDMRSWIKKRHAAVESAKLH